MDENPYHAINSETATAPEHLGSRGRSRLTGCLAVSLILIGLPTWIAFLSLEQLQQRGMFYFPMFGIIGLVLSLLALIAATVGLLLWLNGFHQDRRFLRRVVFGLALVVVAFTVLAASYEYRWTARDKTTHVDTYRIFGNRIVYRRLRTNPRKGPGHIAEGPMSASGKRHGRWKFGYFNPGTTEFVWYRFGKEVRRN